MINYHRLCHHLRFARAMLTLVFGVLSTASVAQEEHPTSRHWAFTAPERPVVPDTNRRNDPTLVIRSPIDVFVADRLVQEGLAMSPPAAPEVLCRRIYLDVIGLPPAPSDVDEFVAAARDDPANAVEVLVDRLLESEHYGEKWARHWLRRGPLCR